MVICVGLKLTFSHGKLKHSNSNSPPKNFVKGAMKLYFMHYSRVVIIVLSTGLYKFAFSTYSSGKTRFTFKMTLYLRIYFAFTKKPLF